MLNTLAIDNALLIAPHKTKLLGVINKIKPTIEFMYEKERIP